MKTLKRNVSCVDIGKVVTTVVIAALVAFCGVFTTGCPEAEQMMQPVVTEPVDKPVEEPTTTVGEVKQEKEEPTKEPAEEKKPEEPESKPEPEPEEPTDTEPPTVTEVDWYSDRRMEQVLTDDSMVRPGDTVYIVVRFSEPVTHIVAGDETARPALFIEADRVATQYRILPRGANLQSGEAKPLSGVNDYLCKYTVPADIVGALTLLVGSETADEAGNGIAVDLAYTAPFRVMGSEPVVSTVAEIVPPLKTLLPPVAQEYQPPASNPGDFVGQVRTLHSTDNMGVDSTRPIAEVSVTITAGSRSGEQVITNEGGYYRFLNVNTSELYLRVEREYFEPKEVIVYRSRPTVLQRSNGPTINRGDPWNTPGVIVIGQRWPDEIRFIFAETVLPDDVLLVIDDGYRPVERYTGWYHFSDPLSGIIGINKAKTNPFLRLRLFAHELGHAHQHALEIIHGTPWEKTPEGKAYARAREKDLDEVGKSFADYYVIDHRYPEDLHLLEGAADFSSVYWGRDTWATWATRERFEVSAPNRYRWAEEWLNKRY